MINSKLLDLIMPDTMLLNVKKTEDLGSKSAIIIFLCQKCLNYIFRITKGQMLSHFGSLMITMIEVVRQKKFLLQNAPH